MDYKTLLVERSGRIITVTLNRPERLNSLSAELTDELGGLLTDLANGDEDLRCLVLTGAGRAFCAGGDTGGMPGGKSERPRRSAEDVRRGFRNAQRVVLGLQRLEIPTIAMVNGDAVGAGFDLACACDLRTAAQQARFMVAYRRIGLIPGWGGAWLYPRRLGLSKAAELMFTGDFMSAEEGYRLGMINRVVPAEQLQVETMALAGRIASGPPISLRLMKQMLYRGMETNLETSMLMAATGSAITLLSEDHVEGISAFREKRSAEFQGR
ncbi:MAG: enoyl-CoA hydratase/isomerase family protein [Dehalococcoidia bacterium]